MSKTVNTSDLQGVALDWAVANCEKLNLEYYFPMRFRGAWLSKSFRYSTDWAEGGPIIEREKIATDFDGAAWCASDNAAPLAYYGPTPLVAAMRCYVASKLGDTVDIPEEIL